jgi:ammonia channel protein AmtB
VDSPLWKWGSSGPKIRPTFCSRAPLTLVGFNQQKCVDKYVLISFGIFQSKVVGCLSYWLFGYAIAWSQGNSFVGWNHWAFANLAPEKYKILKINVTE